MEWDSNKDDALWEIIFKSSSKERDWEAISAMFNVSLPFLLQQAAWLWECRMEGMKAEVKKLAVGGTPAPNFPPEAGENAPGSAEDGFAGKRPASKGTFVRSQDRSRRLIDT